MTDKTVNDYDFSKPTQPKAIIGRSEELRPLIGVDTEVNGTASVKIGNPIDVNVEELRLPAEKGQHRRKFYYQIKEEQRKRAIENSSDTLCELTEVGKGGKPGKVVATMKFVRVLKKETRKERKRREKLESLLLT